MKLQSMLTSKLSADYGKTCFVPTLCFKRHQHLMNKAHSSVRKGAAPRASPGAEREPFEPRQLQDFLSSPSADIWRYYCPEQKASGDAAIVAG
eukprot:s4292_g4.t1